MEKEALIAKLKAIVKPYIQDEEAFKNLSENTDFVKDLKINSANLVDVILEKMLSVKAAMDIVNEKLAAK
jgi:acyl carrier protein